LFARGRGAVTCLEDLNADVGVALHAQPQLRGGGYMHEEEDTCMYADVGVALHAQPQLHASNGGVL